jgi:hypothetical protein
MRRVAVLTIVAVLSLPGVVEAHKLKLSDAKQAAQREAEDYSGFLTAYVTDAQRLSKHRYYFLGHWEYQTLSCELDIIARFAPPRTNKVKATVEDERCNDEL